MPESVTDRPTKSHEYVFLLAKSPRYFFDADAVREDANTATWPGIGPKHGTTDRHKSDYEPMTVRTSRNIRSVWTIATAPYPGAHFACVDPETEALTPDGWRKHEDLRDGDLIAQWSDHALSFVPATFHRYAYDGPMVSIEKRDASMLLTPNHRCIVMRRGGSEATVAADQLVPSMSVPMTAGWSVPDRVAIGPDRAALLGWYIAEGWRSDKAVRLSQSETANPDHVATIDRLLRDTGATTTRRRRVRQWRGRPAVDIEWRVTGEIAADLIRLAPDKRALPWMATLPTEDATALLDALIDGDGHRRKDGRASIVQKDRASIDAMQMVAIRLGYRAQLSKRADGVFALYLTRGRWLTLRGTNGATTLAPRIPNESGVVWCPNVPSGYWLARRHGKPFITGNTFPPKLVEPCVKAGTSERGVCPECGAPWKRVTERIVAFTSGSGRSGNPPNGKNGTEYEQATSGSYDVRMGPSVHSQTTGWRPTCAHEAEPVPAVVLDPFAGSGTVGMVARWRGRRSILIDLKAEYLALARLRNVGEPHVAAETQLTAFGGE
jgi:hypothetical protein